VPRRRLLPRIFSSIPMVRTKIFRLASMGGGLLWCPPVVGVSFVSCQLLAQASPHERAIGLGHLWFGHFVWAQVGGGALAGRQPHPPSSAGPACANRAPRSSASQWRISASTKAAPVPTAHCPQPHGLAASLASACPWPPGARGGQPGPAGCQELEYALPLVALLAPLPLLATTCAGHPMGMGPPTSHHRGGSIFVAGTGTSWDTKGSEACSKFPMSR